MWLDLEQSRKNWNPNNGLTWKPHACTKNNQICFHWHHFYDPANLWQSTMADCTVSLGCTKKAILGIKLLPVTVSAWQWIVANGALQWTHNGCFSTQMHGRTRFQLLSHPHRPSYLASSAHPPSINWIHDIGEARKKVSELPAASASLLDW